MKVKSFGVESSSCVVQIMERARKVGYYICWRRALDEQRVGLEMWRSVRGRVDRAKQMADLVSRLSDLAEERRNLGR